MSERSSNRLLTLSFVYTDLSWDSTVFTLVPRLLDTCSTLNPTVRSRAISASAWVSLGWAALMCRRLGQTRRSSSLQSCLLFRSAACIPASLRGPATGRRPFSSNPVAVTITTRTGAGENPRHNGLLVQESSRGELPLRRASSCCLAGGAHGSPVHALPLSVGFDLLLVLLPTQAAVTLQA